MSESIPINIVVNESIPKGEGVFVDPGTGKVIGHIVGIDYANGKSETRIHELKPNRNGDVFPGSGSMEIELKAVQFDHSVLEQMLRWSRLAEKPKPEGPAVDISIVAIRRDVPESNEIVRYENVPMEIFKQEIKC